MVRLGDGDFTVTPPLSGVAELDAVASALTTTAQRLGALVERERAFTADASHQLRTPLTSLRLALESELVTPRPDPVLVLTEAITDVDRLEATLTDLLALARDTDVDRTPSDLAGLLRDRAPIWRQASRVGRQDAVGAGGGRDASGARVISRARRRPGRAAGKAVQHGSGAVAIEAHPARGGAARIVISDEGHIDGDAESIFERRSSRAAGHGIGLALARSLAHAEGASLRLAAPCPTTFEVLIAATVAPAATNDPTPH